MSGPQGALLRVIDLVAGWGQQPVLQQVSLAVRPGERVGLLGPNGAGKTTLFDCLAGRLRPSSGRVLLRGEDITSMAPHLRARAGLGYVPQGPSVFVDLTVRANLKAALDAPAARQRRTETDLAETLDRWSLTHVSDRPAGVLSGGERRRLEVARTLLLEPSLVLLDEPFAGLDPKGRSALRSGLESLRSDAALLITDHAADDVVASCGRIVVLVDGTLVSDSPAAEFAVGSPEHRRYFGP
jgi:lipopolysaccharide export system ATP-binding protein